MLKFDFITDPDVDRAIGELLDNVVQLATSGHADIAHRALCRLSEDGPWRLPRFGSTRNRYEGLLLKVCSLAGVESPATSGTPAMSVDALREWADERATVAKQLLVSPGGTRREPAGTGWSSEFLERLPSRMGSTNTGEPRHLVFGRFCVDAEAVLRHHLIGRLGAQPNPFDVSMAEWRSPWQRRLRSALKLLGINLSKTPDSRIEIAAEAQRIDPLEIVRAASNYLKATGFSGGHMDALFSGALLLMLEAGRISAATEVAEHWLQQNTEAADALLGLSVIPSVAAWIRSGEMAAAFSIERHRAEKWLARLGERPRLPERPKTPIVHRPVLTDSLRELRTVLAGTRLAALDWTEMSIDGSPHERAFLAELSGNQHLEAWQCARDLLERTGRWPILCCDDFRPRNYFSRRAYQNGPAMDDVSPAAIASAAESMEVWEFLDRLDPYPTSAAECLQLWKLEWSTLGLATEYLDTLWEDYGGDRLRCEHVLAERERALGVSDPQRGRQICYSPDQPVLVLLPTNLGPHALAYMHFYGMRRGRPEGYVRLLQHWSERYGAELYAHYGTMLEFKVSRPPADLETALELAREHELVAPATLILPGIALRHYAEGLIDHPMWFLHERP